MFNIKFLVIVILFAGFILQSTANAQHVIPENFCISQDELKLYNLINKYREKHKLPEIPLSKKLCYVAKLHVSDLYLHRPDTAECNLHSWSDKGVWAECCYGPDIYNNTCMTSKPREMTTYPGNGYEIAFWESVDAIPEIVLNLWASASASRDLILNREQWSDKQWKALGTGMLKGYAVVWFGSEEDEQEAVRVCQSRLSPQSLIDSIKMMPEEAKDPRYYLIIASFKDRKTAQAEVNKYDARGFRNPSVLQSGENFRVSLGNYATQQEAVKAKKSLGEKYQKAWILKH